MGNDKGIFLLIVKRMKQPVIVNISTNIVTNIVFGLYIYIYIYIYSLHSYEIRSKISYEVTINELCSQARRRYQVGEYDN